MSRTVAGAWLPAVLAFVFLMAVGANAAQAERPPFGKWLEDVRAEAIKRGIRREIVEAALSDVKLVRKVVKRDKSQPEFKLTLARYQKRVISAQNIRVGRRMADEHRILLKKIADRYGVQPRFILAIWGIETRYGAIKANMPLIPSIATLAYDARRSKYFRNQLFAVLEMLNRGYIELDRLLGSWAGAMGQPQFMPESYLAYAQDFDGDGRRDIWTNKADVFASIANYLAKHRWRNDLTWGRAVRAPRSLIKKLGEPAHRPVRGCRARTSKSKLLPEWQALGVRRADGSDLPTRNIKAVLVLPDGADGAAFLVYRNYHSIMSYNCAHLYAITVGTLADRIGGG